MDEEMRMRKRELIREIESAKRRYAKEIEPYLEELAHIASCEPHPPVVLPDGRSFSYIGPLPQWKGRFA